MTKRKKMKKALKSIHAILITILLSSSCMASNQEEKEIVKKNVQSISETTAQILNKKLRQRTHIEKENNSYYDIDFFALFTLNDADFEQITLGNSENNNNHNTR